MVVQGASLGQIGAQRRPSTAWRQRTARTGCLDPYQSPPSAAHHAIDPAACTAVRPGRWTRKPRRGQFRRSPSARRGRSVPGFGSSICAIEICAALEAIEDEADGLPGSEGKAPGRFVKTPWTRTEKDGERWRRRRHGADGGPRVREGRLPYFDRATAPSPRNSPSRFQAPKTTRASGRAASPSSPIP